MRLLFIFLGLGISFMGFAQKDGVDPKAAANHFQSGNYEEALDEYLTLHETYPKNMEYTYRIAVCYLNSNIAKTKSIPYLELVTRQPKFEADALYLLGRAYHFAYRFEDALRCYNLFKQNGKGSTTNLNDVDREIQNCYNARELMKYPLSVTFEPLGNAINSPYPDYYPFVTSDESFLVYTTKRPEGNAAKQNDGSYCSSVYLSQVKDGKYLKAQNIGHPIAPPEGNVEVVGLSGNGKYMILYLEDPNMSKPGDLFIAEYDDAKANYKAPYRVDEAVSLSKHFEIAASISNDGKTLYFSSDRPGGFGGLDLYVSKRLPSGKWGTAVNMGASINTAYDEDFPNLSPDGKNLYFSSKGHTSMGGYDIFKASLDEKSNMFDAVKNIGYPINTPEDNSNFRISANGRFGYVAMRREDGLGDLDIYRVEFTAVEPSYAVVTGQILAKTTDAKLNNSEVFITVYNSQTNELVGNYIPNSNTGRYVMILAPGTYDVTVEAPGFKAYSLKLNILDKSSFKTEIEQEIILE
jgi:hypothetical protein